MKYDAVVRQLTYAIRSAVWAWDNRLNRLMAARPRREAMEPTASEREADLLTDEIGHLKIAKQQCLDVAQALAQEEQNLELKARQSGAVRELADVPVDPDEIDLTKKLKESLEREPDTGPESD
ncbi:MAG: hypothetical protein V3T65_06985 [Acidobacteriota bacterium]